MRCVFLFVVIGLPLIARAAEHGPVFGLATPTNSKGEWNFDEGVFTRTTDLGSQASLRELVGYGFTPHLMLSVTLPAALGDARLLELNLSRLRSSFSLLLESVFFLI